MAGIYLHIPFCQSRCMYCDFYSTTELRLRKQYVDALIKEYHLRKNELPAGEPVQTIYLGGGTPSMLQADDVARLLHTLPTEQAQEITLEANPADITPLLLDTWRRAGVNRLSIGIQSFHNETLHILGRRHNAETAKQAVSMAQEHGFTNISIDLIYAAPEQSLNAWEQDIEQALARNIQHISTYCLTYEEHTPLYALLKEGHVHETDEQLANDMYATICRRLKQAGFRHYEVSNFALPGYESKHNSSYWNGTPYLGLGAGAHSYDGHTRRENLPNIYAYLKGMNNDIVPHDITLYSSEILTDTDIYNEKIMLGLRTANGIPATPQVLTKARTYMDKGLLKLQDGHLIATQEGINILNQIIVDLMI